MEYTFPYRKDNFLYFITHLLLNVQRRYYKAYHTTNENINVTDILTEIHTGILKNTVILFSRIFPLNAKPEEQPEWYRVKQLGGKCTTQLGLNVTHLISKQYKPTRKMKYAKKNQIPLVNEQWLNCSLIYWRKLEIKTFLLSRQLGDFQKFD